MLGIKEIFERNKWRYGVRKFVMATVLWKYFWGRLKNEMYYGYEKEYKSFEVFSEAMRKYID